MDQPTTYYPPSPANVPDTLIEPGPRFHQHVNLVIASLILFFLIYVGMVLGCMILTVVLLRSSLVFVVRVPAVLLVVLAALFLLKNLVRRRSAMKGNELRLQAEDYPRLFQFLKQVCQETGAPFPDEVYINHEVNAAAGSNVSLAGLITAPKLRLILGLGLLNVINLTEFKALLAHEFGHFSQFRQKSAPYVRLAMQIVANIISGRDAIDRGLQWAYASEMRRLVAPLYWTMYGLNWVLAKAFTLVLRLHFTLAREMEYHADLVAVSVAGSDAVPTLLYKSYWGQECLQQAALDLATVRDHDLHSNDIFYHQRCAAHHLRRLRDDPFHGATPPLPADRRQTVQIFRDDDGDQAGMWNDHPSNYDREENAKRCYLRSDFDERSPWILFGDSAEVRARVSRRFYREVLDVSKKTTIQDAKEVQKFIDVEYEEASFAPKFGAYYEQRFLDGFEPREWICADIQDLNQLEDLVRNHREIFTDDVRRFAKEMNRHFDEEWLLRGLVERWLILKRKRLEFRGELFTLKSARKLLHQVRAEMNADQQWCAEFNRKIFITYHELAQYLRPAWAAELQQRYQFHFLLIRLWQRIRRHEGEVNQVVDILVNSGGEIDSGLFLALLEVLRDAHGSMKAALEESEEHCFPALPNMPTGESVRQFLLPKKLIRSLRSWQAGPWIKQFLGQYHQVNRKLRRLHTKSLVGLLKLQETIGEAGVARVSPTAASAPR
jgi:Zn-dependent protease with chaperone function